jgi:hypothetical protein
MMQQLQLEKQSSAALGVRLDRKRMPDLLKSGLLSPMSPTTSHAQDAHTTSFETSEAFSVNRGITLTTPSHLQTAQSAIQDAPAHAGPHTVPSVRASQHIAKANSDKANGPSVENHWVLSALLPKGGAGAGAGLRLAPRSGKGLPATAGSSSKRSAQAAHSCPEQSSAASVFPTSPMSHVEFAHWGTVESGNHTASLAMSPAGTERAGNPNTKQGNKQGNQAACVSPLQGGSFDNVGAGGSIRKGQPGHIGGAAGVTAVTQSAGAVTSPAVPCDPAHSPPRLQPPQVFKRAPHGHPQGVHEEGVAADGATGTQRAVNQTGRRPSRLGPITGPSPITSLGSFIQRVGGGEVAVCDDTQHHTPAVPNGSRVSVTQAGASSAPPFTATGSQPGAAAARDVLLSADAVIGQGPNRVEMAFSQRSGNVNPLAGLSALQRESADSDAAEHVRRMLLNSRDGGTRRRLQSLET